MGTPLQQIYDRFFSKVDEDFTSKEGQVFALLDSAISKSYKTVRHSLNYTLDKPTPPKTESYSGEFDDTLDSDEIELLALWMKYGWNDKKLQRLLGKKRSIGTKDFNRLEDLKAELVVVEYALERTLLDINSLKNEFNTYVYS